MKFVDRHFLYARICDKYCDLGDAKILGQCREYLWCPGMGRCKLMRTMMGGGDPRWDGCLQVFASVLPERTTKIWATVRDMNVKRSTKSIIEAIITKEV
jgi:hypothetical protein